jgi:hypothetical protein
LDTLSLHDALPISAFTAGTIDSFAVIGTALPTALTLSKSTGVISGAIADTQAQANYSIRAYNASGTQTVTLAIKGILPNNIVSDVFTGFAKATYRVAAYTKKAWAKRSWH